MLASLKLSKIEENLTKMLGLILGNQNLLRYVKYLDDDPLNKSKADVIEDLIDGEMMLQKGKKNFIKIKTI
jgi:hypothetical protein